MRLRYIWIPLLLSFIVVSQASAQGQFPVTAKMEFVMDYPLVQAQSFIYKHYIDAATVGTPFTVACTATSSTVTTCQAPLPALTAGNHTISITSVNGGGESVKVPIPPLAFEIIVAPRPPSNFKLVITSGITG